MSPRTKLDFQTLVEKLAAKMKVLHAIWQRHVFQTLVRKYREKLSPYAHRQDSDLVEKAQSEISFKRYCKPPQKNNTGPCEIYRRRGVPESGNRKSLYREEKLNPDAHRQDGDLVERRWMIQFQSNGKYNGISLEKGETRPVVSQHAGPL